MSALRVVLFVEGSHGSTRRGGGEWLDHLWLDLLVHQLGLRRAERVVPISKANLVALAVTKELGRRTSRIRVTLDELLKAEIERGDCDAAVVAWDLQPKWDTHPNACRLNETLDLYRLLAESAVLPEAWRLAARRRFDAVAASPGSLGATAAPRLLPASVVAVCMEPDFEALLCDEQIMRRALGLEARRIRGWPKPGDWSLPAPRRGDALLQQAVLAAQRVRPQPAVCRRIRGDMRTAKHEWAAHILASLSEKDRQRVRAHPIGARLREVLPLPAPTSS